jgi:hypothetical protein
MCLHGICWEWLKKITRNESGDSCGIEEELEEGDCWRLINVAALNLSVTVNSMIEPYCRVSSRTAGASV